jgi:peptidylprolyl isomerase
MLGRYAPAPMIKSPVLKAGATALAVASLGLGLAACGSSSTSTAAGVVLAPGEGATTASATATTATPTATTAAATVTTPKTGALSKQPVITKPTGAAPTTLVKKDLITGTGATAASGDQITVNYVGELYSNGKIFDSSWKTGQVFGPFALGQGAVIPGWDQGLVGMKVGGRRELIIPPKLAYGSTGSGSTIPKNATLIFVVDLLGVSK